MALVQTMKGLWDTDKGAYVNPGEAAKQAHSKPKSEPVDNSTEAPKKAAKKVKK